MNFEVIPKTVVHAETKVAYEFGCDLPEHMLFCDDSPSHCKVTSIRTGSNETTPKKKRIHDANIAETFCGTRGGQVFKR